MSNLQQPNPAASFAYPISSAYPIAVSEPAQTQTQTQTSTNASSTTQPTQQSRQAAEEARKDRTLAEFMLMLDDYEPLVLLKSPEFL